VRYSVQEWPTGGFVIIPSGQPPLPVIFASHREAQDYADALSAQDRADAPATLPLRSRYAAAPRRGRDDLSLSHRCPRLARASHQGLRSPPGDEHRPPEKVSSVSCVH